MISKEQDLSILTEIFETIFDIETPSLVTNHVIAEHKLDLIHDIEKTLSVIWEAVNGSPDPSVEDTALLKKLQEMVGSLRHGMFELGPSLHKPSLFSGYTTIFGKRSLARRWRHVGR